MTDFTPSATEQGVPAQTNGASVKRANPSHIPGLPEAQGLYDPRNEHDACGVGFIAQMKGVKSHKIVEDGLFMLENLTHRGAVGADPLMGDGAGVLVQIPDGFFREEMAKQGIELPPVGHYGVGHWFMPQDAAAREHINEIIAESAQSEGLPLIGFRDVPVDNSSLSKAPDIAAAEPFHRQVFIGRPAEIDDDEEYEARLYLLRKVISGRIYAENDNKDSGAYCVSLSARTIVYKGMFLAYQVGAYYKDLKRPALRDGADPRSPAFLDQHLPVVEARRIPTAWSRITARSTRCAATTTGWRPARRPSIPSCSATTSPSSGRSPMRGSRTPPASTTRSSSCSRAATRWRMP